MHMQYAQGLDGILSPCLEQVNRGKVPMDTLVSYLSFMHIRLILLTSPASPHCFMSQIPNSNDCL